MLRSMPALRFLVGLLLAWAPLAMAAPRPVTQAEQAAAHYREGQRAYSEDRFEDALRDFQLGYALAPRPEFLINFAQVHRRLGRLGDAAIDCERYLASVPASPMAEEVARLLAAIREEQALTLRTPPPPAVEMPIKKPIAPEIIVATSPPSHPHRRALIGGRVAGGAVIVGVAVTLGIVLSRGNGYPDAPLRGDFR